MFKYLKNIWQNLHDDLKNIKQKDPAAKSILQIILCYPGFHAILIHRAAHFFYQKKLYLPSSFLAALARFFTGIEIHSGAVIGRRVFIDHGMGVVIGETAVVGDDCTLYQGVTLGGTSLEAIKRHPTLEIGVTVSSGAKVLGNIRIGAYAKIGANAVVLHDVPAGEVAVGVPAKVLNRSALSNISNINHRLDVEDNHTNHKNQNQFTPYCPDQSSPLEGVEQKLKIQEEAIKELYEKIKKLEN